jgi:hypothetical protein
MHFENEVGTGLQQAGLPGVGNLFDGIVHCGKNGMPVSCMKGHLFNPAPRAGFAWDQQRPPSVA